MQPLTVRALSTLAIGLFFAGCSGNGSTATAPSGTVPDSLTHLTRSVGPDVPVEYVYVTNAGSNNVSAFHITAGTGALTTVTGSPFAAGSGPRGLAVAVGEPRFLYVANTGSNSISAFHILAGTGALTTIGLYSSHGTAPDGVASIGKCVFTANGGSNTVSAFYIKGSPNFGALMFEANYPTAGSQPENIAIDAASSFNPFVYVSNEGSGDVTAYKAVPTYPCTLTLIGSYSTGGTGPFGLAFDPTGPRLVVANLASSTVSFFTIGGGGALTLVGTPITSGGSKPVGVAVSNGYAFAPNENSDTVSSYKISTMSQLPGSPGTGTYPQGVAVDPLGLYAYVANESTHNVSGYTILSGVLTSVGSPVLTGGTAPEFLATCQKSGNKCKPPPL